MLKLILDKGLSTEKSILLDHLYEHPLNRTLSGSYSKPIKSGDDFPDISEFIGGEDFETVDVLDDDGMKIPVCDGYNHIQDIVSNYDAINKYYNLSIALSCKETESEK